MDDIAGDFTRNTERAIAAYDAGTLLDQRKAWAKNRAAALDKWEKARGALEADEILKGFDTHRILPERGALKTIAAIKDPPVIVKILSHLGLSTRAPPRAPARRVDLSR